MTPALLPPLLLLHTLPVREWDVVAAVLCRFPFPLPSAARACERGRCVPLFLATQSCPCPRCFVPRAAGWGPVVSLVAALAAPWSLASTFVRAVLLAPALCARSRGVVCCVLRPLRVRCSSRTPPPPSPPEFIGSNDARPPPSLCSCPHLVHGTPCPRVVLWSAPGAFTGRPP